MRFAPEGIPFMAAAALLAAGGWAAALWWTPGAVTYAVAGALTLLALFNVWFFRDPRRAQPDAAEAVLAPGEGRVIAVTNAHEPTYLGGEARRISIFLTIFDVHVQRAPVSGTVEHVDHRPGRYLAAWLEKASEDNEQASIGIATPRGRVLVKQIAGLVARRIVTDPTPGSRVERGSRIGLIRFGSRVDLFLPLDWEVTCAVGDRARVGVTVLARQPAEVPA